MSSYLILALASLSFSSPLPPSVPPFLPSFLIKVVGINNLIRFNFAYCFTAPQKKIGSQK